MNTWDRILVKIKSKIGIQRFETWFAPTIMISDSSGILRISVPNELFAEWLKSNYKSLIDEALSDLEENPRVLKFEIRSKGEKGLPKAPLDITEIDHSSLGRKSHKHYFLNPKYTFESFVVSDCNSFAHAAAEAVAKQRSSQYNPLYIYGGVGLGKTHLMQAIGNDLLRMNSSFKLIYISSENFMNELIHAIRTEKTPQFREKYRKLNLLLIDDIQFLVGKERTQEEFFHTFNALHDAKKQIVITSDCAPKELSALEERLKSRFEWGLIADIQPPDFETKVAILNKKAEIEGFDLPTDVSMYIASKVKSNIRQLEGALIRLMAYTSLKGFELNLDRAKEALEGIFLDESPVVTAESIQKYIANFFNIKVSELKSKNNSKQIVFPRQIAMYLCKHMTALSLPEIGKRFGGKHHSTVIHSLKKIDEKLDHDKDFSKLINNFMDSLK